ncbi:Glycosyltransferase family 21 protein [Mycena venus]|uniref:Ceramide glucosyltransferase n=1 Tax=Mycena venus TaxID=2733690 RepID=A0A8H6XFW8_9AGAR|nr:Glycosyltransferase family 21 protein [Mycena venus]
MAAELRLVLASVGLLWYAGLWVIGIVGCSTARRRYRLRPRSPLAVAPASSVPGVSILRPLKGLDMNLYENLESTFTQEYPNYELLLSVADERDQALSVARELMTKYPSVNCRIIIGEEVVGVNPKVNNLVRSYREAAHDILWVIDSNVTVHPGTLARSVDALVGPPSPAPGKRRIALVHHVPFALVTEPRIGSRIEEAFLNTNHAKMYLAINTAAVDSCVMGKSNLYRRSDLERVNGSLKPIQASNPTAPQPGPCGLPAFGRFLAEDNMIASALWHELGDRHDLSCDVARNVVGNMSLSDYVWRRARWIRVRKHMVLAATLLEPFTESVVLSVICAASLGYLSGVPYWISVCVHFTLWIYVDLDVYASLAGHPLPSDVRWQFMAAWTARELLALPIFLFAVFGSEVSWRGRTYRVLRNGEVARAEPSRSWLQHIRQPKNYEPLDTGL